MRALAARGRASAGAARRRHALAAARPGPLRRLALIDADLALAQAAKERLGGTVNDVVLAALAGALGAHLRARGEDPQGCALRALVPVAGAGGGELLAAFAPLPVGTLDARRRHAEIARALDGLRASGRAAGARRAARARRLRGRRDGGRRGPAGGARARRSTSRWSTFRARSARTACSAASCAPPTR